MQIFRDTHKAQTLMNIKTHKKYEKSPNTRKMNDFSRPARKLHNLYADE